MLHRLAAFLLAFAAIGASPANAEDASGRSSHTAWDMVSFEVKSWGRPVHSWRILPTGGGSWTEAVPEEQTPFGKYKLVWHEVEVGEEGYAKLVEILQALPDPAPDYQDCANAMSDMPYGTIRLTRGSTTTEIEWNSGCLDDGYVAFVDALKAADALVGQWGRAGKVLRTENSQ
ncbi:MAG: hypothetical protein KDE55_17985 [Novosphingobium sp.]|nr:hypothetical protein [Novosphingobium sp.]